MESNGGKQAGDGNGGAEDRKQSKDTGNAPPPHLDEQSKTPKKRRKVNHGRRAHAQKRYRHPHLRLPSTDCSERPRAAPTSLRLLP